MWKFKIVKLWCYVIYKISTLLSVELFNIQNIIIIIIIINIIVILL